MRQRSRKGNQSEGGSKCKAERVEVIQLVRSVEGSTVDVVAEEEEVEVDAERVERKGIT